MGFRLYGTAHCHLCEQAQVLLAQCRIAVEHVDIAEDDALLERYGVRIPVLSRVADGAELDWPFDADQLQRFCA
ncbi:MAG: glutaredoxin family protein [Sideroxydans sp.]